MYYTGMQQNNVQMVGQNCPNQHRQMAPCYAPNSRFVE